MQPTTSGSSKQARGVCQAARAADPHVGLHEQEDLTAGQVRADVLGHTHAAVLGWQHGDGGVDPLAQRVFPDGLDRAVVGSAVDENHFEGFVQLLALQAVEGPADGRRLVAHHDDDREARMGNLALLNELQGCLRGVRYYRRECRRECRIS